MLQAGDVRALEMPGLASLHTLWMREHNRLASQIRNLSSDLTDEEIFQIARKILIGEMQNIVYDEYLPCGPWRECYETIQSQSSL